MEQQENSLDYKIEIYIEIMVREIITTLNCSTIHQNKEDFCPLNFLKVERMNSKGSKIKNP